MDKKQLDEILELHKKWLNSDSKGKRAVLSNAVLRYADLSNLEYSKNAAAKKTT